MKTYLVIVTLVVIPALVSGQSSGAAVSRAKALHVFESTCQPCHGPNGQGVPAFKDLAFVGRTKWKHGNAQTDVVKTITNGVPGTPMLPFKGRLSPAEISGLALLVRSFAQPHGRSK